MEIHLLKFLPSQYFLVVGNTRRVKIMYQYSFRDQSKEDDFTDLSQNLRFLECLNHRIFKLNTSHKSGRRQTKNGDDGGRYIKSTHSATKSKMNQHIDSAVNEDRKNIDEDIEYIDMAKENEGSVEFVIPGYLVRISKIHGVTRMSNDDRYYSVMVFQRYIRRRRTHKKDKDPSGNEKYHKFNGHIFPAINMKDRQLVSSSFTTFIRNNLVVDSNTFLKATLGSKQRKKILAATRKAELELEDAKANALIQSYAQSREVRHCANDKRNLFAMKGQHIQVAKSPFDYEAPIGPGDISLKFGSNNKLGQINGEDSSSIMSVDTDNHRTEYHYQSDFSSNFLDDSYTEQIKKQREGNTLRLADINKDERRELSRFFDEDSSILLTHEMSEIDYSGDGSSSRPRRHQAIDYSKRNEVKMNGSRMSDTRYNDFFGMFTLYSLSPTSDCALSFFI